MAIRIALLRWREQLGLSSQECVVVEDAAAGIEAAIAGGFRSIGLGPPERVGAAEAMFPGLAGLRLPDILRALGENPSV